MQKAQAAVASLQKKVPAGADRLHWAVLDLSTFSSIKSSAQKINERFKTFDVLLVKGGLKGRV